ncbi:uncharacterized protein LOC128331336 [Hemicordylus capensis]|uniref:uncharacterized protein LOC128331336 n=1 Tax=Hemicordylus capensis TaxID=884348 RepID=UPI0023027CEF|nr:uncharacterized protein LOC128331336 [Hemicordylus capensis]
MVTLYFQDSSPSLGGGEDFTSPDRDPSQLFLSLKTTVEATEALLMISEKSFQRVCGGSGLSLFSPQTSSFQALGSEIGRPHDCRLRHGASGGCGDRGLHGPWKLRDLCRASWGDLQDWEACFSLLVGVSLCVTTEPCRGSTRPEKPGSDVTIKPSEALISVSPIIRRLLRNQSWNRVPKGPRRAAPVSVHLHVKMSPKRRASNEKK